MTVKTKRFAAPEAKQRVFFNFQPALFAETTLFMRGQKPRCGYCDTLTEISSFRSGKIIHAGTKGRKTLYGVSREFFPRILLLRRLVFDSRPETRERRSSEGHQDREKILAKLLPKSDGHQQDLRRSVFLR